MSLIVFLARTGQADLDSTYTYDDEGRMTSVKYPNSASGEQVVYTYDSLQRLATAQTTAGTSWGQSYTYDGWGNLNDQNVTAGSAPAYHVVADPTTNRVSGQTYDANGNALVANSGDPYDIENRLTLIGNGG